MVDFAGWWMPVQYSSIVDEHLATRRAIGLFDVSHMGRLAIEGPAARDWLESLLTRRVSDIAVGQARYTLVTSDEGPDGLTILDDALVTREADAADGSPRFAMVVNASNRERVVAWLRSRLPATGVSFTDRTAETAMIAVQGPLAVATVCVLCGDDDAGRISGLGNYRATRAFVAGQPAAVSRTGYTGEDGVEVVVAAAVAEDVWQAIHDAGVPRGLAACGLGARDTLRLEAGMPLYGHELVAESDPFAIGLGLAVNLEDPAGNPRRFPGREALEQKLVDNPKDVATLIQLIRAAIGVRDFPLARLLALRALELDEKNAEVLNLLGVASFQSNFGQDAAEAFKKSLKVNSKYAPAQANLGVVWATYGDAEKGKDLIAKAGSLESSADLLPQVRSIGGGR
jgi:aminomethyltransferase